MGEHIASAIYHEVPEFINDDLDIKVVIVPKEERRTTEILQLNEIAGGMANRIAEISNGGYAFVGFEGCKSARDVAIKELLSKKTPLTLVRVRQDDDNVHYVEHWDLNEMTIEDRNFSAEDRRLKKFI